MALDPTKLATLDGGVQQLHIYKTNDTLAGCKGGNYWDSVTNRLKQGDFILVAHTMGGAAAGDMLMVTSATGATVVTVVTACMALS